MWPPTVRDHALSQAGREYLKVIYELQGSTGRAVTSAVAGELGVSDPSVTGMVKKLTDLGLLSHTPYHGAKLTPAGEVLARRVLHRRELIALYLIGFLGYSAAEAGAEADCLEHAVSEKLEHCIETLLRGMASAHQDDSVHPPDV